MKPLLALFTTALLLFVGTHADAAFRYVDKDEIPSWAEEAIELVRDKRIMTGYTDGKFRPKGKLNRAQAVTLILRLKDLEEEAEDIYVDLPFNDVPEGAWFYNGVKLAYDRGWIRGKSETRFAPEAVLNNAEWATMIVRAFDLEDNEDHELNYRDVPSRAWFTPFVRTAHHNGLMRFPSSRYFNPEDVVTRADGAWLMAKILGMPRLMGTAAESQYNSVGGSRRRVAIKPRNFNANKQSVDVIKKGLQMVIDGEGDVLIGASSDYMRMGTFTVTNTSDGFATFDDVHLRLRFDEDSMGPEDEFEVQMVDLDTDEIWATENDRQGTAVFTGIGKLLKEGGEVSYEVFLRPKPGVFFFQKQGTGSYSIFKAGGITSRLFNSTGRMGKRYTPINIQDRDFADIHFDPTK